MQNLSDIIVIVDDVVTIFRFCGDVPIVPRIYIRYEGIGIAATKDVPFSTNC